MKLIQSTFALSPQFRPAAITLAVGAFLASSVITHAGTSYDSSGDPSYNKIGDLTIYQPSSESNKPTLTLMLDKSGSMKGDYSFIRDYLFEDTRVYRAYSTRRQCFPFIGCFNVRDKNFYYFSPNNVPANLVKEDWVQKYTVKGLVGKDNQLCVMRDNPISNPNNDLADSYLPLRSIRDGVALEACLLNGEVKYDRMSSLKNAIYELIQLENMNEDIALGIGAFGYGNSKQGQIKVPAKPLDATQKQNILAFLGNLNASGGTPMAAAYTDAGAYMLGNSSAGGIANNQYSGMLSTSDTEIVNSNTYRAPEAQQCGAEGIYLLTDGLPNSMGERSTLESMMKTSLNLSSFSCPDSGGLLEGAETENNQWKCMGAFAKKLRTERQVTTAMVGFGATFDTVNNPNNYTSVERTLTRFTDSDGAPYRYNKKYYDCSQISATANPDARNACNLGMESGIYDTDSVSVGGYGQGGFFFAKDTKDIVGSVLSVIQELETDLPSIPAGTITVPADPLSSLGIKPYAYLPMLEPKVGSDASIWAGNLKKYHVKQATLYGKDGDRLYVDDDGDGFPDDLNPNAQDIWSTQNQTVLNEAGVSINVNNRITAGGFYAQLKTPKTGGNTTRNVYVENIVDGETQLLKVGVTDGALQGFGDLDDSYKTLTKLYLLNFLGYDASPTQAEADRIDAADGGVLAELEKIIINPPGDIKVLGGVIHSRPTLISYGANINANDKDTDGDGKVDADAGMVATDESSRDDYVMFGSMEGALHIASADSGQESLAFIPKTILNKQIQALQPEGSIVDAPVFGVDAPWSVQGSYKYDFSSPTSESSGKILADKVYVYGGLRQGGKGVYGLDVSSLSSPEMLFSINNSTDGYQALGKVWSEPVSGKIKVGTGKNSIKDVIIFGGGYDECYEDPTFRLDATDNEFEDCNKSMTDGNAVYIADAKTGDVIWSISGRTSGASGKHIQVPEMKHSVVSKITTLDRDDDGMIDHLYFGDLGGQLFRVDLRNGQAISGSAGINNFTRRIVKVLDGNSGTLVEKGLQRRFYGQPSVSFYKDQSVLFALVNIASGDRSNPISRLRNDIPSQSDRLFGVIDRDIASPGLYGEDTKITLATENLDSDDLIELPFNQNDGSVTKAGVKVPMRPNVATSQGWFYPLNQFDGNSKVKNVKSMGDGMAIGGLYYMTAYSPEMKYDETSGCAAQIVGGSERQIYCLPYGICEQEDATTDKSSNGTGGFVRAGKGIQELAFGAFNPENPTTRIMLGTQSFSELVDSGNRIEFGGAWSSDNESGLDTNCPGGNCGGSSTGADNVNASGSGGGNVSIMDYRLFTTRWYEQLSESVND
ncbi:MULTISPECIES: PilC/PilY family type IV pilus protein [unclassified Psychrobacter]|uniref:PilC/PilY family type IV pilus protein n=1 Tax=unclassified Psychrobacter TaxID=196806 RepID=UPI00041D5B70|nr:MULTISPECIES: PilC/PilY family type IV pilus protein [unclassified Psychrobacter]